MKTFLKISLWAWMAVLLGCGEESGSSTDSGLQDGVDFSDVQNSEDVEVADEKPEQGEEDTGGGEEEVNFQESYVLEHCTYYVDSELGDDDGDGSMASPWKSLSRASWQEYSPGDGICFRAGRVWRDEMLFIEVSGTEEGRIEYGVYGEEGRVKIENGLINISGASYVTVKGFEISGSEYAGIVIQSGAHHIGILNNHLHDNGAGVWMGNDVGMNNVVEGNEIDFNAGNGIGIERVFCEPGQETLLRRNRIHDNVWHGIELSGNYHIVEGNWVYHNGANPDGSDDLVGHSGIHLFSRYHEWEEDLGGDHNIIRGNIVYDNLDRNEDATDGNGIQMDMWCDDNEVYNNIVYGNDGPGITIYGGSRNEVYHNTLYQNGRHLGIRWAKTELIIGCSDEVDAEENVVTNNIAYAESEDGYAVFIGDRALTLNNRFSHNLYGNGKGGPVMGIKGQGSVELSVWNGHEWANDLMDDPELIHGHELSSGSPAIDAGESMENLNRDVRGMERPCGSGYDIGAYEYCEE